MWPASLPAFLPPFCADRGRIESMNSGTEHERRLLANPAALSPKVSGSGGGALIFYPPSLTLPLSHSLSLSSPSALSLSIFLPLAKPCGPWEEG